MKTLAGHMMEVNGALYSPDGEKILSFSYDKTIKEWDVGTGECIKTMTGHKKSVNKAEYSKDGKRILSDSLDGTIKEWDVNTGKCLKTHKQKDNPIIIGYPTNDTNIKLKTKENKIYILDTSGQEERELINVPGLLIQGCSFKNLHPDSDLSAESKNLMRRYGAEIDE